jgi:hypothetical protein
VRRRQVWQQIGLGRAWPGAAALVLAVAACLALPPAAAAATATWPPETIRIGRMALSYDELAATLSRVEIGWRADQPIAVSIDRIAGPPGTVPLWASARLRRGPAGWGLTGVAATGPGDLVVRFEGSGLGTETGRLQVRSEPVRFAPGGLQPDRLWPGLAGYARNVSGTLRAIVDWPAGGAVLSIDGLGLETDYGPVGPIDGTIALDRAWPPRTAEPQRLRIEGLRLAPLVEGFEIAALGAEGTIDADLLFSFTEDGRLFLDEGRLVARGPGVLRYRDDEPPAMLAGQGQGVDLLFTALADFRYQSLTAIVRGYLDDELTVELQLSGSNPELYEGYPIELNVNLEAPVLPLALAGRDVLALPDVVRRALEQGRR